MQAKWYRLEAYAALRGGGLNSLRARCGSQFFFCAAFGLMFSICGFFVCAAGELAGPSCGFGFGRVRRNFTGPFSFPFAITASNSFESGLGLISTIRKLSLLGSDVIFCTSFVSVFWT